MTKPVIRVATADDAVVLSELIQNTVRHTNAPDYEPTVIELICNNFTPAKIIEKMREHDVFACDLDDLCLGTVSLGDIKLHSLFVDANHQRQGIGAMLVAHLERHAVSKGLRTLELSSSITARAFYEKHGYQVAAFEERLDGSTYLMRKQLSRPDPAS